VTVEGPDELPASESRAPVGVDHAAGHIAAPGMPTRARRPNAGRCSWRLLWSHVFGGQPTPPGWFVSEYALPVPDVWRAEMPYTYRCVDLACGIGDRVLIVELKTEPGSYRADQMPDYLRLARRRDPAAATDVILLGPLAPGYRPGHHERQRYAELTWADVAPLVEEAFPGDDVAARLARFLRQSFPAGQTPTAPASIPESRLRPVAPRAAVDVERDSGLPWRCGWRPALPAPAGPTAPSGASMRCSAPTKMPAPRSSR
jgi:hypothetical protein